METLQNKKSNWQLGYEIKVRIGHVLDDYRRETEKWKNIAEKYQAEAESYRELVEILKKHGLGPQWIRSQWYEELDKRLEALNSYENLKIIEEAKRFWKALDAVFAK